jgi:IMP dehydrogenase
MRRAICFDDVLLEPQHSDIESRTQISLAVEMANYVELEIPIVSSPMDTVTEVEMALAISNEGGLGILHRYNTIDEQVSMVKEIISEDAMTKFGVAIGVTGDFEERANALVNAGCRMLCLDVAHGHHTLMKNALQVLRKAFGNKVYLMAGNVATLSAFNDLADWGADALRVGVGGGSICSTRIQTGHGIPTLQSVIDCAKSDRDCLLIADGGIKNSGDITKCLAAGADLVMVGSLLSGTSETPGDIIHYNDGSPSRKIYRGMASREAQKSWRGKVGSIEGVATTVVTKGPVSDVLKDLVWGVKSGLSYSGCRNLLEFQGKSKFIEQTTASQIESNPHVLRS